MNRVIFLGSTDVGKTMLIRRIVTGEFTPNAQATVQTSSYTFKTGDLTIQLWDTAGMEKYRAINRLYYRNATLGILLFDLTSRETFDELNTWKREFFDTAPESAKLVIVGSKCDDTSKIEVDEATARRFAIDEGLDFFMVSSKTGEGVDELVDAIKATISGTNVPEVTDLSTNQGYFQRCC